MTTPFLHVLSRLFGWVYTICWSLSFYPQPILNYQRRSTTGTTVDWPAINSYGFLAYFVSTVAFLYSPHIRNEYASRNHGFAPTVQFNDMAFAGHAFVISSLMLSQYVPSIWGFDRRARRRLGFTVSKPILAIICGSLLGVAAVIFTVAADHGDDPQISWAWLDVIYAISYVKVLVTLVKYTPQILTNHRNKSTQGWSILQVLLDFSGGILSTAQLSLDSYLMHDWSGITGNPVKLALGNISMFFDIIFMTQHYILYPSKGKALSLEEEEPFIDEVPRDQRLE